MTCACQHVLAEHTASAPATLCSDGPVNPGSHPESRPVTSSQLPCGHHCDPGATLASLKEGDSLRRKGGIMACLPLPGDLLPADTGPAKPVCHVSGRFGLHQSICSGTWLPALPVCSGCLLALNLFAQSCLLCRTLRVLQAHDG